MISKVLYIFVFCALLLNNFRFRSFPVSGSAFPLVNMSYVFRPRTRTGEILISFKVKLLQENFSFILNQTAVVFSTLSYGDGDMVNSLAEK